MKRKYIIGVLLLALSSPLLSQEPGLESDPAATPELGTTPNTVEGSNRVYESWYTYWGLGSGVIFYPSLLQDAVDRLKNDPSVSNLNLDLDLLGFYWSVDQKTMAGVVINSASDGYLRNNKSISIGAVLYAVSVQRSFGPVTGDGFFLRFDAGAGRIAVSDDSNSLVAFSEFGYGGNFGIGFAFPAGNETSITFTILGKYKNIEGKGYSAVNLVVGALF